MTEREGKTLHQACIDFRFVQEVEQEAIHHQADLICHPGASYDTKIAREVVSENPNYYKNFVNKDHQECGVFIKIAGDDSDKNHEKHMNVLKEEIGKIDPEINFTAVILPFSGNRKEKYSGVHHCPATAIMVGEPEVIRQAVERLTQEDLMGKHDLIARPGHLQAHSSILENLELSMKLHKDPEAKEPFMIFIFDTDSENAIMLEEKVKKIAGDAKVESIVISEASSQEAVA